MTDTDLNVITTHGFSRAQAARAIAKHPDKRTDREQRMIVDLVTLRRGRP